MNVTAAPRPSGVVGMPATAAAPPAVIPLTFLAAAGVGLAAFGMAIAAVAGRAAVAPTAVSVIAAVHIGMLGFLATAVLGALHQFCPVVGGRPLRSTGAARVTAGLWIPAVVALPAGFATDHPLAVSLAGVTALTALLLAAWNLSASLAARGRGAPVTGLRWAVGFLVATAAFGVVYAFDRHSGWFPLMPHRVLAHAHLGLIGALGLTYVAVAEKLWPMFLLAHLKRRSPGELAVRMVPAGVVLLVFGLLLPARPLAVAGAVAVVAGLAAHLASLAAYLRHRRRRLELLHGFVLAGAAALVTGATCAGLAGLAPVSTLWRGRLVSAEVAALAAWLGLAVVGHAHKIVPFIVYTTLRAAGVSHDPSGHPLLFTHLYDARVARATLATTVGGFCFLVAGLLVASPGLITAGGIGLAATGVGATANLALHPLRLRRSGAGVASAGPVLQGGAA